MKKILALVLAFLLIFALAACAKDSGGSNANTPASQAPSSAPPPASQAPATVGPLVGTVDDDVDYFSRPPYKIVWAHLLERTLEQEAWESFNLVAERFNVELTRMSGGADQEQFINNLQALVDRGGIDGIMILSETTIERATVDVLQNSNIPYVVMFTPLRDAQGRVCAPVSGLDHYACGTAAMKWLTDNYTKYWGNVDPKEIGVIGIDFSIVPVMNERIVSFNDGFLAKFPDNGDNIFYYDSYTSPNGNTLQAGYDATSQIVNANPHIKYWMVMGCNEDISQGAARAAEDLGLTEDNMLVTAVGTSIWLNEWRGGYTGAWQSIIGIYTPGHTTPGILGLIAILDGRATPENLWPQYKASGDLCAIWEAEFRAVTYAEIDDYLDEMNLKYGLGRSE